jgi:hypothetical protein
MWLSKKTMYCFYYAEHPAHTMSYHWKDCCRLTTRVSLKFGKLLRADKRGIARMMVYHSGILKRCVMEAFKAETLQGAVAALEKMGYAKANCFYYHYEAEKLGMYTNFAEAYSILKPVVDMGFYNTFLRGFFKRKFHPPKPHIRLSHHYMIRAVLKYPPRFRSHIASASPGLKASSIR